MWRARRAGGFLAAAGLAAAWLLGYAAWTALRPGSEHTRLVFSDTVYLVPILAAAVAALVVARVARGQGRIFWGLIAAATGLWLAGEVLWSVRELSVGEVPFPWWSDLAFLQWYVLMGAALCFAYRPSLRTVRLGGALDALVMVVALSILWWWGILRDLGVGTDAASLTAIAYPVLDLGLIGLLVATRLLPARRGSRAGSLVTAAVLVGALADSVYTRLALTGSYESGGWLDLAWQLQGLLLALAAVAALSGADRGAEWRRFRSSVAVGTGTIMSFGVLLLVGFLAVEGAAGELGAGSLAVAGILAALLVLRGWVILTEDAREGASRDPATGVYGGNYLFDQLRRHVARARSFGEGFALVLLDAPDGSDAEARVVAAARDVELAGRLDDERLAVLVPLLPGDDARRRAEELRSACGDAASGGLAVWEPELEADELILRAGDLLASARRLGANHVRGPAPDVLLTETELTDETRRQLLELAAVVDRREAVEDGHSFTVALLAARIARRLELPHELVEASWLAGLLHDIGKIPLPEELLRRGTPLSGVDRERVARHTVDGAELASRIPSASHVAGIVRALHEHLDGSGRPDGLAGAAIPPEARVVAVAERLVSMTAERPHRAATGLTSSLAEIWRVAGARFDPLVVSALFALVKDGEVRQGASSGTVPVLEVDGAGV